MALRVTKAMSKENISATIDPDVKQYIDRDAVNTSGLINKLLRAHMEGDIGDDDILEFRIQQVESEIDELQSRIERKKDALRDLNQRKAERHEQKENVIAQASEALSSTDLENATSPARYWADQADCTVSELAEQIQHHNNTNTTTD